MYRFFYRQPRNRNNIAHVCNPHGKLSTTPLSFLDARVGAGPQRLRRGSGGGEVPGPGPQPPPHLRSCHSAETSFEGQILEGKDQNR